MSKNDFFQFIKSVVVGIIIFFAMYGIASLTEITEKVYYYENGTKIDAIKYHNEIYLKKGE